MVLPKETMTQADSEWMKNLLEKKVLDGPVLELGTGYGGGTSREMVLAADLVYFGTDIEKTPTVDFVADFDRLEDLQVFSAVGSFGAVLILNVLEHTFNPIQILDNAISLLKPGGSCVINTPTLWPLHNYPIDTWRPLPNFYEEYARRRQLILNRSYFDYVGIGSIEQFKDVNGNYSYPPPSTRNLHSLWSRGIHKLFNTFGRAMFHPSHVAIGVILQKPLR
jgi:SAM-dependent methyltransferase